MSRVWKAVLGGVLVVVVLCCGGGVTLIGWAWSRAVTDTVGGIDFVNQLPVPPLAPSRVDEQGRRVFELTAAAGRHDFGGHVADTWGFNGSYLGPTLRAARGERVVVNVRNQLREPTTLHWHGMHLPAVMDGGPHQTVRPGGAWSPTWHVDQPAATLWYHPHPHGRTADHVYRGLAGMFLVDDESSDALALPNRYGVDDIPLIVQDKKFDGDELDDSGALLTDVGVLGDEIMVNAVRAPFLHITTEAVRLRLLNASNARTYRFGLSDDRTFDLVATDGGLLERPYATDRVQLSPGERAEIIVRVHPAEHAVLRSYPPELGGGTLSDRFNGGADRFDVLQLRAAADLRPTPATPTTLLRPEPVDNDTATTTRSFRLTGTRINSSDMNMNRIDATVTRGTTEIWEVSNRDGAPHNFHVHGVSFRVLPPPGGSLSSELMGSKDTVFVRPSTTLRLLIRFHTAAGDPDHPYMFHCHLLRHEDNGMMGQFLVVEPRQPASTPSANH